MPSSSKAFDDERHPPEDVHEFSSTSESTPLLSDNPSGDAPLYVVEDVTTKAMFWEEFRTIARYSLPIFG